ncbi:MAG: hypothetical protein AB8H80_21990 [Planctomycetota bacterium]
MSDKDQRRMLKRQSSIPKISWFYDDSSQLTKSAWLRLIEPTTQARQLFAQAAGRPTCSVHPSELGSSIDALTILVALHGYTTAIEQPQMSLASARVLLHRAKQLTAGADGAFQTFEATNLERCALAILSRALKVPRKPNAKVTNQRHVGDAFLDSCKLTLLALKADRRETDTAKLLRGEIGHMLDRHRPRLRDVFQKTPGGYQPVAFRRLVQEQISDLLAPRPERETDEGFEDRVHQRIQALGGKAPRGTPDDARVARGIAHLALLGLRDITQATAARNASIAANLKRVRDHLATDRIDADK